MLKHALIGVGTAICVCVLLPFSPLRWPLLSIPFGIWIYAFGVSPDVGGEWAFLLATFLAVGLNGAAIGILVGRVRGWRTARRARTAQERGAYRG